MKRFLILTKSGSLYEIDRKMNGKAVMYPLKSSALKGQRDVLGFSENSNVNEAMYEVAKEKGNPKKGEFEIEMSELKRAPGKHLIFEGGHTSKIVRIWYIKEL